MSKKGILTTVSISVFSALIAVYFYSQVVQPEPQIVTIEKQVTPAAIASTTFESQGRLSDLTFAAEKSVNAVVHVMTKAQRSDYNSNNPFYEFFFGPGGNMPQPSPVTGSGSGVILTQDGYIITNNHVINEAQEIEVVLNDKRTFIANLVGADPTSDIALLKIDADDLPYINYGDSDNLKIGEWVLAVGNPFNLTSTVTAGIVSAKARSINIIANGNQPLGIESFIQTDAAVNPGNSGGALVNQRGELVGINTAIASRTGSYTGYSFAVPIAIAKKVVADLMEYGTVQRGLLGVTIVEVNEKSAQELEVDIDKVEGVFIVNLSEDGGAKAAGLKSRDIIISVDGQTVNTVPELQQRISIHRPGDQVHLIIKRDGKKQPYTVILRNTRGTTSLISADEINEVLGATFEPISQSDKIRLRINHGIKVKSLKEGRLKKSGVKEGYIITKANRKNIGIVDDFRREVGSVEDALFLSGIYANGQVVYYAVDMN